MATLAIALLAITVCGAFAYGAWQERHRQQEARRADEAEARTRELQAEVGKLGKQVDAAQHDSLTGLLTRDQWEWEAAALLASGQAQAMLWIDVDRFKEVNTRFGHLAGNVALGAIGERLRTRKDGLAGRFGGDEFVVVLRHEPTESQLERLAVQLGEPITVTTPLDQAPRTVTLTVSIGVAVWPSAAPGDLPLLLDLSDRAMREAKTMDHRTFIVHRVDTPESPLPSFPVLRDRAENGHHGPDSSVRPG